MKQYSVVLVLLICGVLGCGTTACWHDRQVSVHIVTRTEAGAPISDVPLEAVSNSGFAWGRSDANGVLDLQVFAEDTEPALMVRLSSGTFPNHSPSDRLAYRKRFDELRNQHSFSRVYMTPMSAGIAAYSVEVIAYPMVTVTGQILDGDGNPRSGGLLTRSVLAVANIETENAGSFSLAGLRQGQPIWVLFQGAQSSQAHPIRLDANLVQAGGSLGQVACVDLTAENLATIQVTNVATAHDSTHSTLDRTVTLVRADGTMTITFPLGPDGLARADRFWVPPKTPQLPLGVWYVAPGMAYQRPGWVLLLTAMAGRQAQLDAAGVPKLTVVAGEPVSLSFDAIAAQQAIIGVGGDLSD